MYFLEYAKNNKKIKKKVVLALKNWFRPANGVQSTCWLVKIHNRWHFSKLGEPVQYFRLQKLVFAANDSNHSCSIISVVLSMVSPLEALGIVRFFCLDLLPPNLAWDWTNILFNTPLKVKVFRFVELVRVELLLQFVGDNHASVIAYRDTSRICLTEAKYILEYCFSCLWWGCCQSCSGFQSWSHPWKDLPRLGFWRLEELQEEHPDHPLYQALVHLSQCCRA